VAALLSYGVGFGMEATTLLLTRLAVDDAVTGDSPKTLDGEERRKLQGGRELAASHTLHPWTGPVRTEYEKANHVKERFDSQLISAS
jgi:hypothetical protein